MNTHGGTRPGAGRPKKEQTTTLSFRVPARWAEEIKKEILVLINKFKSK
jgi:hypothetical protein